MDDDVEERGECPLECQGDEGEAHHRERAGADERRRQRLGPPRPAAAGDGGERGHGEAGEQVGGEGRLEEQRRAEERPGPGGAGPAGGEPGHEQGQSGEREHRARDLGVELVAVEVRDRGEHREEQRRHQADPG